MQSDFLGFNMQQQEGVVPAFDQLLKATTPSRIIELGTGFGGLTVFLGLYGYSNACEVSTYDNEPKDDEYKQLIAYLGVTRYTADLFSMADEIAREIASPGKTILICDNGNKVLEFNNFASALKAGDVIMAHDYYRFMTQDPEILGPETCCEISYDRIERACKDNEIEYFMGQVFTPELMWFCGQRQ